MSMTTSTHSLEAQHLRDIIDERDHRYNVEANLRAEALRIKDEGDKEALRLAREIQTYKDEKANELREQINRERGLYATKDDLTSIAEKIQATVTPLAGYIATRQGRAGGLNAGWSYLLGSIGLLATFITIFYALART